MTSSTLKSVTKNSMRTYVVLNKTALKSASAGAKFDTSKGSNLTSSPMRFFSLPPYIKLQMPSLSPTMEKGNLTKWCKQVGDEVQPGDILAEVETDKATVDFEMQEEGYVAKLLVEEGTQDVELGELVAILVEDKDDIEAFKDFTGKSEAPVETAATPAAPTPAAPTPAAPTPAAPSTTVSAPITPSGDRVFASPLARKLAGEQGVNLSSVEGTGPRGRIVAADLDGASPSAAQTFVSSAPATLAYEDTPLTNMRKIIASRLSESKDTIPHYYVTIDSEIDDLLALRARLNQYSESKISVNDLIIKASALAAIQVPQTNSSWQGDFIRQFADVDMSVAVSTPKGLITPIIREANKKGLQTIATEMKDLAARARENKLKLDEFQGGTFSVSNLGMFGVSHFAAIINPPQACILAIGGSQQRVLPRADAGEGGDLYRVANVLSVTLSSDHRVVDGAEAAIWGQNFKKYLENPELMLL
eukprot:CAMPEP_0205823068 /NCGR_PEP_ID=MMETSP0206-20130828/14912_1 /ASSEMBLY_ACC=CAM_ASM_000279 /TAXON_ID=36767 /ORGANISM="Euplotes focardii, Strain TN1" /LENGTH=474 /DNA_ID=CAMNT_0053119899 /DNA_START=42 /DNA_END=1466 /DNA_ORIENTATION=+